MLHQRIATGVIQMLIYLKVEDKSQKEKLEAGKFSTLSLNTWTN